MSELILEVLAGGREAGRNAYLLRAPETGWSALLDAGRGPRDALGWIEALEAPPAWAWISHAHTDHVGAWPELVERWGRLDAYSTPTTRALSGWALGRLVGDGARGEALVGGWSTQALLQTWRAAAPEGVVIEATAYPAGHLPGAASLCLDIRCGEKFHRLYYTGDFCAHDLPTTRGAALPASSGPRVDTLLMEGALATVREADAVDVDAELDRLRTLLADHDGPRLLAATALGESGELVAALDATTTTPLVILDALREPLARSGVHPQRARFGTLRACADHLSAGGITLATGDQLDAHTPARQLAEGILWREDAHLITLNAMRQGSPLQKLHRAADREQATYRLGPHARPLRAQLHHLHIPTHAPRWALLATVRALNPRRLVLVHAPGRSLDALALALKKEGFEGEVVVPGLTPGPSPQDAERGDSEQALVLDF